MTSSDNQTIYLISGPLGVGKTSVSKKIAEITVNTVIIEGDAFFLPLEKIETLSWEERLQLTWKDIVCATRNAVEKKLNVVIDFVVEEELEWFCQETADLHLNIKYVVLVADEDILDKRLRERDDSKYFDRSSILLHKLKNAKKNKRYLYDITHKTVLEIAHDVIENDALILI